MKASATAALSLAVLSACAAPAVGPARRYIGTAAPTTPGPLCPTSTAEAQIRNGQLILAPDEGTWVLEGPVNDDGSVSADKTVQGINKQPFETTFQGQWTRTTLTGTYKTPHCTFSLSLNAR